MAKAFVCFVPIQVDINKHAAHVFCTVAVLLTTFVMATVSMLFERLPLHLAKAVAMPTLNSLGRCVVIIERALSNTIANWQVESAEA